MLLNKHNLDFCSSLKIGKDGFGHDLKIRIDKLTVVSCFHSEIEKTEIYSKLEIMRNKKYKKYRVQFVHAKAGKPYRRALLIRSIKEKTPVLLRIDYTPINRNTGGIRLDFRPQHLTANGIKLLLSWIIHRLGEIFRNLLIRAWVTQIDVALDIYNCKLHDHIWGLERSGKSEYFNTKNGLPGLKIGSTRSLVHILCYGKVDTYGCKKLKFKRKDKFFEINFDDYKNFLRIESRFKPNAKPGKKKSNALMLANILSMRNPFERLQVYSKELGKELLVKKLIKVTPQNEPSITALKQCIMQQTSKSRLSRNIINIIRSHEIELFHKEKIWNEWPNCVSKIRYLLDIICHDELKN